MEQIYNFEGTQPPVLNEEILRTRQNRKASRNMMLLLFLGVLIEVLCVAWFAAAVAGSAPLMSLILYGYIVLSMLGGGTFAICYARKGGAML